MFSKFYELMLVFAILNQQVFLAIGKGRIRTKIKSGNEDGEANGQCWADWQLRRMYTVKAFERPIDFGTIIDIMMAEDDCPDGQEFSRAIVPGCYEPSPTKYYCWGPLCQLQACEGAFPFRCFLPALCLLVGLGLALVNVLMGAILGGLCVQLKFMCTIDNLGCFQVNVVNTIIILINLIKVIFSYMSTLKLSLSCR
jgi:hypothetical protein